MSNISKDFVTKNGIILKGTSLVTGLTSQTNALQVDSGAAIAKNLIVGSTTTIYGAVTIANNAASTSTTTGALIIEGGVGIGGNLNVAGTVFGVITGVISTASNLAGGTAGQLVYQSAPGLTAYAGPGSSGEVLTSGGTGAPVYVSTTTLYVNRAVSADNASGTASQANSLNGGVLGEIPYQSAANTTLFIGTGTQGSLLQMGANTASFVSTTSIQVSFAANLLAGAGGSLPYQSAANATAMLPLSATLGAVLTAGASAPTYITQVVARNGTGNTTTASGQSLLVSSGGLGVIGDSHFADNVYIGKQLTVQGATTFEDTVTFNGTATFVFSTNTYYTDNIVNIHTPPGGVLNTWTSNDGKDIGVVFHNFVDGYDNDAFLGYHNQSGYLEWFDKGSELSTGTFVHTRYGTFKTGAVLLDNNTGVHDSVSGALQVKGGVGIAGNLFVAGVVTATTFNGALSGTAALATDIAGGTAGQLLYQNGANDTAFAGPGTAGQILVSAGAAAPVYTNTSSIYVNSAVNAEKLYGGTAGQLVYQSSTGTTAFAGPGTAGEVLVSNGANAPSYVSTTSLYVNRATIADSAAGGSGQVATERSITNAAHFITFVDSNNATSTPETVYTTSTVTVNPATGVIQANTFLGTATTATNIAAGTAGQLIYQSAPGVTAFAGPGSAGQVLTSNGTGAPTYVATSTLYVFRATVADSAAGSSAQANNLNGGALGQIPYQVASDTTAFIGTGTNGSILQMGANTATFVATASIYVNSSVNTEKIFGGTAGQLVYQSAANTTAFAGPGTAGQILVSAGASAPVYTNTSSIYINRAVTADAATVSTNISGGALGEIPYQLSAGSTAFIGTGTIGSMLQMGANTATFVATATIYVNRAVISDNDSGGSAGGLRYQTGANASTFLNIGSAGQLLRVNSAGTAPEWVNTSSVYAAAAVSSQNLFGGTTGQLVYQSAAGTTAFAGPGTAGQLLVSAGASAPVYTNTGSIYVNSAVNAQTLYGGTAGQLHYQSGVGVTAFAGPGTTGQILISGGTGAPNYQSTLTVDANVVNVNSTVASVSTTTGALIVDGGVGVAGSVYVGNRVGFVNASNVSAVYQIYNTVTNSLDTVFA